MRILANDGISSDGKFILEAAGYTVSTEKVSQDLLARAINEDKYDILIIRSATQADEELLSSCPNLKLVVRAGVGLDNVDLLAAKEYGIKVKNTPAASSQSVAELVMGQMFALARGLHDSARNIGYDEFDYLKKKYSKGIELRGKTLGIIGFGRIGRSLAGYAAGIGMDILPFDIEETETTIEIDVLGTTHEFPCFVRNDLRGMLRYCDFVSVHIPKTENGDSVINATELGWMKDGVILVNAARGGVVNEDDLIDALESGKVAAAGLDVFEDEPNPNELLLKHRNILPTPHIGAATVEAQDRIGNELANLILEEFGNFTEK